MPFTKPALSFVQSLAVIFRATDPSTVQFIKSTTHQTKIIYSAFKNNDYPPA
jgi:hypothetical protein